MTRTDWLGREYRVGDLILYAATSSRSVQMILGRVVEMRDNGNVKVQPLRSSRWKQHYGRQRWIDNRTGKGIDPYCHVKSGGYQVWVDTGERISDEERWERLNRSRETRYVPTVFEDYVEKVDEGVKPVTLQITENIVRWDGDA
jgi:hypothetical protein